MNNNILLLYKSHTGFTKKYAELIASTVNCTLSDSKIASVKQLSDYDIILFGSRAYAGTIDGYKTIQKLFEKSTASTLILFVTGATPATAKETIQAFWNQNLSAKEQETIPHFYLPGGLCYEKMSTKDRWMMKIAATMIKKKKNKTASDREFEQAIASSYDLSDPIYITELVSFLQELCK